MVEFNPTVINQSITGPRGGGGFGNSGTKLGSILKLIGAGATVGSSFVDDTDFADKLQVSGLASTQAGNALTGDKVDLSTLTNVINTNRKEAQTLDANRNFLNRFKTQLQNDVDENFPKDTSDSSLANSEFGKLMLSSDDDAIDEIAKNPKTFKSVLALLDIGIKRKNAIQAEERNFIADKKQSERDFSESLSLAEKQNSLIEKRNLKQSERDFNESLSLAEKQNSLIEKRNLKQYERTVTENKRQEELEKDNVVTTREVNGRFVAVLKGLDKNGNIRTKDIGSAKPTAQEASFIIEMIAALNRPDVKAALGKKFDTLSKLDSKGWKKLWLHNGIPNEILKGMALNRRDTNGSEMDRIINQYNEKTLKRKKNKSSGAHVADEVVFKDDFQDDLSESIRSGMRSVIGLIYPITEYRTRPASKKELDFINHFNINKIPSIGPQTKFKSVPVHGLAALGLNPTKYRTIPASRKELDIINSFNKIPSIEPQTKFQRPVRR